MTSSPHGRILLGEDDWTQADVLKEVLESEGYEVKVAVNPQEVVQHLRDFSPAIALLDVRGVSSREVVQALQATVPRPGLVLVSADTRLEQFAREAAADAFVQKPYELEVLLGTLARVREERPGP